MKDLYDLFPEGSDKLKALIEAVRESIAHVKDVKARFLSKPPTEATWSPVVKRLGRGREGKHGYNSGLWSGWNRTDFTDILEANGIKVEYDPRKSRTTFLIDTKAA